MTTYYIGLFLLSHLVAGLVATIIDVLFYREEISESIEDLNQTAQIPFNLNRKMYIIAYILGGWFTLFLILKDIFDYYFEPDDE